MDLLQLRYFIAIAETQHMTRAAEKLMVSQPSLSNTLARIENELGVKLFNREGRNIVLNDSGEILLKHAKNIFRELDNIRTELDILNQQQRNTITIGSVDSVYVKDWLPIFIKDHPEFLVRHIIASCGDLELLLSDGSIDFAILDHRTTQSGFKSQLLGKDQYAVLTPLDGHFPSESVQDFSAFRDEAFICSPKIENLLRPIDILSQDSGFEPNIIFEGEPILLSRIYYLGYGNIIFPLANIATQQHWELCRQNAKIVFLKNERAHFDVDLLWDARRTLSDAGNALVEYIKNHTKQFRSKDSFVSVKPELPSFWEESVWW